MSNESISEMLNSLYSSDSNRYAKECESWKKMGYKIYRNDDGEHKVVPPTKKETNPYAKYGDFGDIFFDIFGGK